MIKMVHKNGYHFPKIFCDFCGELIEKNGNVVWRDDLNKTDSSTPVLFAHKGCDKTFTDDGEFYLWQELEASLVYLFANTKIDYPKAKETAMRLSQIGL